MTQDEMTAFKCLPMIAKSLERLVELKEAELKMKALQLKNDNCNAEIVDSIVDEAGV